MLTGIAGVVCLESMPPGFTEDAPLLWHPTQLMVLMSVGVLVFVWQSVQLATELLCTSPAVVGKLLWTNDPMLPLGWQVMQAESL